MRVAAPAFGPAWTAELRVLIGGLALLAWFRPSGFDAGLRRHWRSYLLVGAVEHRRCRSCCIRSPRCTRRLRCCRSSTPPRRCSASPGRRSSATSALRCARRRARARHGRRGADRAAGGRRARSALRLGGRRGARAPAAPTALAGVLIKRYSGRRVAARHGGRQPARRRRGAAAAPAAPAAAAAPTRARGRATCSPSRCSRARVAFVLYFRLIADVGATRALTVTYLIPLFGVFWGWLFLGEALPAERARGRRPDPRRDGPRHARLEWDGPHFMPAYPECSSAPLAHCPASSRCRTASSWARCIRAWRRGPTAWSGSRRSTPSARAAARR